MAEPTVAVLGTGRMGSAMAERLAGAGVAVIVYNRTPDRAHALAERSGRASRPPRPRPRARRTSSSRWSPTTRPSARCTTARTGVAGGHRAGVGRGRHEHGPARHDPGGRAGRARPRRRHPRRARVGAASRDARGRADDHGRWRRRRPRARPAGPRSARQARLPPRAAGVRRGHEARRQHADLRAQRRRRRGPRPRRAQRHRPRAGLRRACRERRRRARSSATSGRPSSTRTTRPLPSRWRSPRRTCASSASWPTASGTPMPQAAINLQAIRPPNGRSARTPTSPGSPVTCVRRAGDDRSAMKRRQT